MTHTPSELRALLDEHGLAPSRALGQNFMVDPATVRRLAHLAGVGAGDHVVEIGAGLGSLTLALVEQGATVTAVETDRHLLPALRSVLARAGSHVTVVEADATTLDWSALLGDRHDWVLVANLPYNIATPLVLDVLDDVPQVQRLVVLVQREAGERLIAGPGSSVYGIPSVKVAYHATGRLLTGVHPSAFVPRPRVDSVLVELTRRPAPAVAAEPGAMFELVRTAFGQRRKMLRRSLAGRVDAEAFAVADVDPTTRPEQLSVQDWGRLASAVAL